MQFTTRLAPSPTGWLHLGNAWSFMLCWLAARSQGGKVILRMDDIDGQRSKPEYASQIISDLEWLGLDWDYEIQQSNRQDAYAAALEEMRGTIYPCFCSRRELRQLASAPHVGDEGAPYSGICASLAQDERERRIKGGQRYSLRLGCPDQPVEFPDVIQGWQRFSKRQYGGDFAVKRSDGTWAYQLASAVDDCDLGVNFVMRGRDLLPSTPRQIIIASRLGSKTPAYAHVPLLLDHQGERLAKRHASLSLRELRRFGAHPQNVTGYLAFLAGMGAHCVACTPSSLLQKFQISALPKDDITINIVEMEAAIHI